MCIGSVFTVTLVVNTSLEQCQVLTFPSKSYGRPAPTSHDLPWEVSNFTMAPA
jgi:hypothetical protein